MDCLFSILLLWTSIECLAHDYISSNNIPFANLARTSSNVMT